jgi:hypothetical protein
MKKVLLFIFCGCFMFSCSKEKKSPGPPVKPPGDKTYAVTFKINTTGASGLKTNSVHAETSVTPVSGSANQLQYWVYDSSGKLITQLYQTKTTTNFGQITDTFSAGTYSIVIVAQNNLSAIILPLTVPTTYSTGAISINGNDTFFKTYSLTVTDTTSAQDVTLDRIDGQLQVKITDAIPTAAQTLGVTIVSERGIAISTGLPNATASTFTYQVSLPDSVKGKTNFTLTTYIANTVAPFTANIFATNSAGTKYVTATVDSVTCQVNERTLLSGALFNTSASNAFNVTFNNAWDGSPTIITFSKPSPTKHGN